MGIHRQEPVTSYIFPSFFFSLLNRMASVVSEVLLPHKTIGHLVHFVIQDKYEV